MQKKKSAGNDGLSQEHLVDGATSLSIPQQKIINKSISTGTFPSKWKEATVTPVLKKGDKMELNNYRPVSCLPVAS